jgi:hypothetical protein
MDHIGWFIATLHGLVGHDAVAAFIGAPAGDRAVCVLCVFEADPSPANRQAVIAALAPEAVWTA